MALPVRQHFTFDEYKTIASLEEVVLVSHDRREIEVVRREQDGSWSRHVASDDTPAIIASLGIALSIGDVYRNPLAS